MFINYWIRRAAGNILTDNRVLPSDIKILTATRFFVAIWVVVFHYAVYLNIPLYEYTSFFRHGYLGVDFFFTLSGFILAHVYFSSFQTKNFSYKNFLIRRFSRIYPIHFFTLIVLIIFSLTIQIMSLDLATHVPWERFERNLTQWENLPAHILLLHGLGFGGGGWNYPSWSISSEWYAYLLFPIFIALCIKLGKLHPFSLILLSYICMAAIYIGLEFESFHGAPGIFRITFEFLSGVLIYLLSKKITFRFSFSISCLLLLLITFFAFNHFYLSPIHIYKDIVSLGIIYLIMIFSAQISKYPHLNESVPNFLVYLGEISYGIYMWHAVVELFYFENVPDILGYSTSVTGVFPWLISFPVLILVSSAGYHFVETPSRRLLNRIAISRNVGTPK